ncbi:hypothetical protein [Pseudomonas sp. SG-MS2]|uniref:hypothetical protein n=1 Tax=Pseudomonas sp. SG-MS2 TaxID=1914534 RepID=UPI00137B670C|nr:hypothetical protein [Pseudomonas sp. SG-MS2]
MHIVEQQIFSGDVFKQVRTSSLLNGKALLASGGFSLTFEGSTPVSVYHLSIDNAGHDFSVKAKQHAIDGVAKIFRNYGAVAIYQHDPFYPDYLWLAEMEMLHPLSSSPAAYREIQDVLRSLTGSPEGLIYSTLTEKCKLLANLNRAPVYPRTMRSIQALRKLLFKYVTNTSCDIDLRLKNFMIRPCTGEVILNGPVNWLCDVTPDWHASLMASGVLIEDWVHPKFSAEILQFPTERCC